jgi:hypothetical protein
MMNPEQIAEWNLPGRPTKQTDSRARRFGHQQSVELDAVHPQRLRRLVEDPVQEYLPLDRLPVLKQAEQFLQACARELTLAADDPCLKYATCME